MVEISPKQRVIVGLGNPGKQYALTRHNLGYLVVQALAITQKWDFKEDKQSHAYFVRGQIQGVPIHLILPKTFMNESGQAVRRYLDFFKLKPENLVVVSDDIALPFGDLRLRMTGSAGGHNGLKSIQTHLGTQDYVRLRMGIGPKPVEMSLADYVLANFSKEELGVLESFIAKGVDVLMREILNNKFT